MNNRGFSLIEMTIALAIVGIFIGIMFPIVKATNRINNYIEKTDNTERKVRKVVKIIENSIRDAKNIPHYNYKVKRVFVTNSTRYIGTISVLGRDFFNPQKSGNTLFIEFPFMENKIIKNDFLIFRFRHKSLEVHEIGIQNKNQVLIKDIDGEFYDENNIIKIKMIKDGREFVGYESIPKTYKK